MGLTRTSNFASKGPRPVVAIGGVIWAVAVATLALLFVALNDVASLRDGLAQTNDHIERLEEQAASLRDQAVDAPDVAALRLQSEKVGFFNALTGPRQVPLTSVLALLEADLPRDVWISQMTYNEETGRLSLSLRTDKDAALPAALRTLEASDTLQNVILERQVRLTQAGRQLAQYDIQAVTR